jgi:hypothetical protein
MGIPSNVDIYRLKYRDAEGAPSDRHIAIKGLMLGDKPSNSYIYAYCFSALDFRQFRFDRIKALYFNDQKIADPLSHLAEKYGDIDVDTDSEADIEALANEALEYAPPKPEPKPMPMPKPAPPPNFQEQPFDILKMKKRRKRFFVAAIIFGILGLLSIPTVIWAIVYLLISGFLFLVWSGLNRMIKQKEAEKE